MLYRTSTAILIATLACIAWVLVGYFAWIINTDESQRAADARDTQMATVANAHAVRTHALALDTAKESSQLKTLLNVDVVSAAYLIEEVGRISGVTVRLGDAQPEGVPTSNDLAPKAVSFAVTADGKFAALVRAVRLFETLPIPSNVTRVDIERTPKSSGDTSNLWHMNVYIRILTTSDISS